MLPLDLWRRVLAHLDLGDIARLSMTGRVGRDIVQRCPLEREAALCRSDAVDLDILPRLLPSRILSGTSLRMVKAQDYRRVCRLLAAHPGIRFRRVHAFTRAQTRIALEAFPRGSLLRMGIHYSIRGLDRLAHGQWHACDLSSPPYCFIMTINRSETCDVRGTDTDLAAFLCNEPSEAILTWRW